MPRLLFFLLNLVFCLSSHASEEEAVSSTPVQPEHALEAVARMYQAERCAEPEIGQTRIISRQSGDSTTGINNPFHYVLTRQSESTYNVDLNIQIEGNPSLAEGLLERAQRCIAHPHFRMRTESGNEIQLRLNTEQASSLPVTKISVQPAGARSTSRAWASDIHCNTIVHELLHLVGLCDEYPEYTLAEEQGQSPSFVESPRYQFDCRAVARSASIMADSNQGASYYLKYCECISTERCPEGAEIGQNHSNEILTEEPECPEGTRQLISYNASTRISSETGMKTILQDVSNLGRPLEELPAGFWMAGGPYYRSLPPPLREAHFRAIVFPECYERNGLFYRCSNHAYTTSYGEQRTCPVRPPECETDEWLN